MLPNKNAINPAKINLHNISNYLSAKLRNLKIRIYDRYFSNADVHTSNDNDPFLHEREQVIYRGIVAESVGQCTSKKFCTYCGCTTVGEGNKYEGWAACETEGCYPEMMNKKEWEEFKLKNNIKL